MDRIIVVSPHPDDETLGAGGTILKHGDLGHEVYWLNVTNMKEEFGYDRKRVQARKREMEEIKKEYGFERCFDLELRPAGLDTYSMSSLVEKIAGVFASVEPGTVILPFKNDVHSDHRRVFESAYACTKAFRHPYVKKVWMMEVVSETDLAPYDQAFAPNCFVDISKYLEKKIEAMETFGGEYGDHPFPRSADGIRALATRRGSQAGCRYAEGFMVLREVW